MFASVLERQAKGVSTGSLCRRVSKESDLVQRLERQTTLEGHAGCVNTASFTPSGDGLLSGSDDHLVILWDWQTGRKLLRYQSGHRNNVFQARALPGSNDATIVTCAADGQVRVGHVAEGGRVETQRLAAHAGRAHKLALEPGQPTCFLSCGEDGAVRYYDLREGVAPGRRLLVCRGGATGTGRSSNFNSAIELNSIHCNAARPWQFCVGGSDETVRVYDQRRAGGVSADGGSGHSSAALAQPVRKLTPGHMRQRGGGPFHVTCAMFSSDGEIAATYNDEDIYLFAAEQQGSARPDAQRRRHARGGSPGKRACVTAADNSLHAAADGSGLRRGGKQQDAHWRLTPAGDAAMDVDGGLGAAAGGSTASPPRYPDAGDAGFPPRPAPAAAGSATQQQDQLAAEDGSSSGIISDGGPFIGPRLPLQPPPGDPPQASGNGRPAGVPDPWDEEAPPAGEGPPRQRRRRRNAFLLPSALLRQGAVVPNSDSEDGEEEEADASLNDERPLQGSDAEDEVLQRYTGHRNSQTVKGVAFCGASDEYVMSGSDCGHIFIWNKVGGRLRACMHGDENVVNCLEQHPTLPLTLATSGIDSDVKIWAPTGDRPREPQRSAAVQRLLRENSASRGQARSMRQVVITPRMLAQLLALHRRGGLGPDPDSEEEAEEGPEQGGSSDDGGGSDEFDDADEDMDGVGDPEEESEWEDALG